MKVVRSILLLQFLLVLKKMKVIRGEEMMNSVSLQEKERTHLTPERF